MFKIIMISDLFIMTRLVKSKNDFKSSISGLYVNNKKIESDRELDLVDDVIDGEFVLLRKGKKNYFFVKFVGKIDLEHAIDID